ncbi:class I SAM-dependent methyltransferase [Nocardiopsis sp. FR4]|uniref:class I SAM-dependent methyltransferase n=1 Tax=Nocardiopsis sp. FR4 TaxID=2605985 RepID=UPI001F48BCDB|nr:class I SAM-dependent methyltransferase [Nocardiopsis sp. FR4]
MPEHTSPPQSIPNPKLYSPRNLARYNKLVIEFSHTWAWKLDNDALLDLYLRHVSDRHLEIGPADAHFLDRTPAPALAHQWHVDVLDLNQAALDMAVGKLAGRAQVSPHRHDILVKPWPLTGRSVDSIACGNVLHCVPGAGFRAKAVAFSEMARVLSDDGVAWGYTLLGSQDPVIRPNLLARGLMWVYNRPKANTFHNRGDFYADLQDVLGLCFSQVKVHVMGCAAVWVVRGPRR